MNTTYPFAAMVGQQDMKLSLILNVINPGLSGVLIRGEKGTGKSTAARALAEILPDIEVVDECPFNLEPGECGGELCQTCTVVDCGYKQAAEQGTKSHARPVKVVELPVGATEDRVVGAIDLERALKEGEKHFEPGILAQAHRAILYVDEVNLLEDHVVDVLLDSAAMGVNTVEREGVSFTHPARFTLVGTMNPEEGELRPQLLDRFGLCVLVQGLGNAEERVEIMERRLAYEQGPEAFARGYERESAKLTEKISQARERWPQVEADRQIMLRIAQACLQVGVDGHRGDIITLKTAKALAAWQGRVQVEAADVDRALELVLPHRVRRKPFEEVASSGSAFRAA
ncbi:MAG: ATP-binding protein [Deltaproteobacteria bacterium]|nr:ATP-binding protein [Deltaproteobacteria bacterium]